MQRYFNTEGVCNPKKHYMVNLDDRLEQIKERYVERGSYFVINRGRQYGKTTTLWCFGRLSENGLSGGFYGFSADFNEKLRE